MEPPVLPTYDATFLAAMTSGLPLVSEKDGREWSCCYLVRPSTILRNGGCVRVRCGRKVWKATLLHWPDIGPVAQCLSPLLYTSVFRRDYRVLATPGVQRFFSEDRTNPGHNGNDGPNF